MHLDIYECAHISIFFNQNGGWGRGVDEGRAGGKEGMGEREAGEAQIE